VLGGAFAAGEERQREPLHGDLLIIGFGLVEQALVVGDRALVVGDRVYPSEPPCPIL
jgi:hypothetical protein